jgi:glutaredoxin
MARQVTLFQAEGCHLCERALEVVEAVRVELGFVLELVDIGGDADLEERYRERLPVIEIDGEEAFTFFVTPAALRAAVVRAASVPPPGSGRR